MGNILCYVNENENCFDNNDENDYQISTRESTEISNVEYLILLTKFINLEKNVDKQIKSKECKTDEEELKLKCEEYSPFDNVNENIEKINNLKEYLEKKIYMMMKLVCL